MTKVVTTMLDSMANNANELLYAYDEGNACHNFLSLWPGHPHLTMTKSCDTTMLYSMANNGNKLLYAYDTGNPVTTSCQC